jgi:monovalent cation:H+ antiporter-2, CPA2 family
MSQSIELRDVLIILIAAIIVVSLFRRLRASAVLGYLVAGALVGPHGLGLVGGQGVTSVLAEFGVVFLLFAIGLELSIERLASLRRYLSLGAAQVFTTTLVFWGALSAFGLENGAALIIASGFALSSTAVVLQMLNERREIATIQGRTAFGVLLLQDLAVVPLLTLIPALARQDTGLAWAVGTALVKGMLVLGLIVAAGRLAVRPMLRLVARGRTPELFTGIVLLLVLGIGWLTEQAGLSMALGAFLAGLLVAETEYRPQVEGDIQPFRGILLALFFMSVGMGLDLALFKEAWAVLLGLVLVLLVVKAGLVTGLGRLFGLSFPVSAAVGLSLAQGGEFGFVLFALARDAGVVPSHLAQLAILVVGLSMAMTPALLGAARQVLLRLNQPHASSALAAVEEIRNITNHVVIAGFGRVGQTLALLLDSLYVPYVALDLDPELVASARERGLSVFFGDASRGDVLRAAGIERAQAAVITLDDPSSASRTVRMLRQLTPALPVLARARDVAQCGHLVTAGATAVVPEVVEGSLQLGSALLKELGRSSEEVSQAMEQFRREAYAHLSELSPLPRGTKA